MAIRLTASSQQYLADTSVWAVLNEGPYTVSIWVYFESFPTESAVISIYELLGGWYDMLLLSNNNLQIQTADSNLGTDTVTGATSLSTATWYFITLIRSSADNLSCYINGVLEATSTLATGSRPPDSQDFRVGADYAARYFLDGRVWGMKMHLSALTTNELIREMAHNAPFRLHVHWYPMLSTDTLTGRGVYLTAFAAPNGYTQEESPPVAFNRTQPQIFYPIETVDFSTTTRNAWLDAIENTFTDNDVVFEVRTGAPPANCAASDTGSVLISFVLPEDWLADASGGSKSKLGTWQGTASSDGTLGHFRIKQLGTCYMQGSISTPGMGGDMIVSSDSIVSGQNLIVSGVTFYSFD